MHKRRVMMVTDPHDDANMKRQLFSAAVSLCESSYSTSVDLAFMQKVSLNICRIHLQYKLRRILIALTMDHQNVRNVNRIVSIIN